MSSRHLTGARGSVAPGGLLTALALAVSACDNGTLVVSTPMEPSSTSPAIVATIGQPVALEQGGFVSYGCSASSKGAHAFDFFITASKPVDLHYVTITMIDGTNLGGPTVTYPRPELTQQFGTTIIRPGASRTFRFKPPFACGGGSHTWSVAADIGYVDAAGSLHSVTVGRPLS